MSDVANRKLFENDRVIALKADQLFLGDVRVPATHDAKNVGTTPYREILVELT